ncbi:hypothetical protein PV325_008262 [Microctonus aethiopoides]|nr:hypothetical protein PV325_008262 [Microctonus aethiopoides]
MTEAEANGRKGIEKKRHADSLSLADSGSAEWKTNWSEIAISKEILYLKPIAFIAFHLGQFVHNLPWMGGCKEAMAKREGEESMD